MRSAVRRAYGALLRECGKVGCMRLLEKALEASIQCERGHRRFMRGTAYRTDGLAHGYRLSVDDCARMFVVRTVLEEVHRIANIVTEFTKFSRLPAPSPEPMDLVATAQRVVALHAADPEMVRTAPSTAV